MFEKNKNKVIDLTNVLTHLPGNKIEELATITQQIVDTGKAEIIILFGSYARGNYKEKRGEGRGKKSDYDILIAVSEIELKKDLNFELREAFKDITVPVQPLIETIHCINSNLEKKHYFFTDVKREGKVLYNSGKFKLTDSKELTPTGRREIAEKDFKEWFEECKDFWKLYQLSEKEKLFRKAAFNLQQTVEMCYTTIEMVFTHYNPYEHYLRILRGRVLDFDIRLKYVLPYETREQIELFDYLDYAYIGGRYRSEEEYPVKKKQLDYWGKEAKKLLDLTETICLERIECLKEIEKGGEK